MEIASPSLAVTDISFGRNEDVSSFLSSLKSENQVDAGRLITKEYQKRVPFQTPFQLFTKGSTLSCTPYGEGCWLPCYL